MTVFMAQSSSFSISIAALVTLVCFLNQSILMAMRWYLIFLTYGHPIASAPFVENLSSIELLLHLYQKLVDHIWMYLFPCVPLCSLDRMSMTANTRWSIIHISFIKWIGKLTYIFWKILCRIGDLKCLIEFSSISEHFFFNSKVLLILCQPNESESISHTLERR